MILSSSEEGDGELVPIASSLGDVSNSGAAEHDWDSNLCFYVAGSEMESMSSLSDEAYDCCHRE